ALDRRGAQRGAGADRAPPRRGGRAAGRVDLGGSRSPRWGAGGRERPGPPGEPRMKLVRVRLPLKRPLVTAAGTLTAREGFLVFVDGGVGEAMPLPSSGTETLEECRAALEAARDLDEVQAPCARFALETALLDAEAKRRGVP